MRPHLIILITGVILLIPIITLARSPTLETLSDYYLAGFIFMEISIFLFDRWEKEKRKPRFLVSPVQQHSIDLKAGLGPHRYESQRAQLFAVVINNTGETTAEEVMPFLRVPEVSKDFVIPAERISAIDDLSAVAGWRGIVEEFEEGHDRLGTALIQAEELAESEKQKERQGISLYGGGVGEGFVVFFTVKGSSNLYFASKKKISLDMPRKFYLELWLQAKDLPFRRYGAYEVDAESWDNCMIRKLAKLNGSHSISRQNQVTSFHSLGHPQTLNRLSKQHGKGDSEMRRALIADEEKNTTSSNYERIFLEAVDESISVLLGEDVKQALYTHFETMSSLKTKEIPDRLDDFSLALEMATGKASKVLERAIAKTFYFKLGLEFHEGLNFTLSDYFEYAAAKLRKNRQ